MKKTFNGILCSILGHDYKYSDEFKEHHCTRCDKVRLYIFGDEHWWDADIMRRKAQHAKELAAKQEKT